MRLFNDQLFRAINQLPEWLSPLMRFFSEATNYLPIKLLLVAMLAAMIWRGRKSRTAAICALIAFPIANGITDVFKHQLPRPRPFQELTDAILRSGWSDSAGTASAHSANMAAVAFAFTYFLGWRWGAPWIAIAFLTGLSRVYNGVHYPYQVLLGWTCGAFAGFVVCKVTDLILLKRSTVREEDDDRIADQEAEA